VSEPPVFERDIARREDAEAARETKQTALRVAVCSAVFQALIKGTAGIVTGSLALLATAFDSVGDFLNVGIARLAVGLGSRPPDTDHPFGHGKIEPLGALVQVAFLLPAAGVLVWQAVEHLERGRAVGNPLGAAVVTVLMLAIGWWTARYLRRTAGTTDSIAVRGSALTFGVDVVTHLGVLIALGIVTATGWQAADAVASIAVAAYILWQSAGLAWKAMRDLLDRRLPAEYLKLIEQEMTEHKGEYVDYHRMRTRQAGPEKHIDFHLTVCRYRTLEESHRLVDHIENALEAIIPQSQVIIHVDPCEPGVNCDGEQGCKLAMQRQHIMPESTWPEHPTGLKAREFEREQHPLQHPDEPSPPVS